MPAKLKFIGLLAVLFGVLLYSSAFIVDQRELAVQFRLGKIVKTDFEPGLYWQMPFLNNVKKFDSRILTVDSPPEKFLTLEKKDVVVDSFVKWRITNVGSFYVTTQGGDERIAANLLSQIIADSLKGQFSNRTIKQVVSGKRQEIMDVVRKNVDVETDKLGIKIVDVRIKRIDFPDDVSESVFRRMEKERETVAKKFRSEGRENAKGIRADADRQSEEILAEAYRESQVTRGEGDAKSAEIYAKAYGRDPEFYAFYRSLNAYKSTFMSAQDIVVVEPDSEFFKYFNKASGR